MARAMESSATGAFLRREPVDRRAAAAQVEQLWWRYRLCPRMVGLSSLNAVPGLSWWWICDPCNRGYWEEFGSFRVDSLCLCYCFGGKVKSGLCIQSLQGLPCAWWASSTY